MELLDVGLVLVGLVLVFFGAALSTYATALLGVLLGAAGGYVVAPQLLGVVGAGGVLGLAVAVIAGGALGAVLASVALSVATAVPSFVVGAYLGLSVVTPLFTAGGLVRYPIAAATGVAGAALGLTLTRVALTVVTAFVGAALASRSVTLAEFTAAREGFSPDPILFDPLATAPVVGVELPLFGVLFALGVLSQTGLFELGWVARLAAVVPGIGRVLGDG